MTIKHKVSTSQKNVSTGRTYSNLIRRIVSVTLKEEAAKLPCVVCVLITDDTGIREYNREHRGIDKATDVLSFPMQDFSHPGWSGIIAPDIDIDSQTLPLGDIIISVTTIRRNARKYGSTYEQETIRMMIHSTLHLLGYDHSEEMEETEFRLLNCFG